MIIILHHYSLVSLFFGLFSYLIVELQIMLIKPIYFGLIKG